MPSQTSSGQPKAVSVTPLRLRSAPSGRSGASSGQAPLPRLDIAVASMGAIKDFIRLFGRAQRGPALAALGA